QQVHHAAGEAGGEGGGGGGRSLPLQVRVGGGRQQRGQPGRGRAEQADAAVTGEAALGLHRTRTRRLGGFDDVDGDQIVDVLRLEVAGQVDEASLRRPQAAGGRG